jgi:SSS family solute:Na+ symporter
LAVYPALAEKVLPPGLKAVFLCGILGTIASAMVGYTLISGATFGREFSARLNPEWPEEKVKSSIRFGLVLAMCVAVPVALQVDSVVDLWYSWAGAMVGALLIPVVVSYLARSKGPSNGFVFASMLIAAAASLAWMEYGLRTNNPYLEVVCLRIDGKWSVAMPPLADALQAKAAVSTNISVGTLLPGLVISAVILALGYGLKRKDK